MINVRKASGEFEPFSEEKVRNSIKRAGIPLHLQDYVLKHVKGILYDNISTSEIYHHIIEYLGKSEHPYTAAKYSLKQAIMDLGPSGYPFEDYFAEILRAKGYIVKIRQFVDGLAIKHEIDIIAEKSSLKSMIECKFHNNSGIKTDAQVVMAVHARFLDTCENNHFKEAWLVTNTKVTKDVIDYVTFYKMKAISWDYPENESLRLLIDKTSLFPVTSLRLLTHGQKQILLENHLVLCRDLVNKPDFLDSLRISPDLRRRVLEEAEYIMQSNR